jgi:hypothetical protein
MPTFLQLERLRTRYRECAIRQEHARKWYGAGSWCHMSAVENTLNAYKALARARGDAIPESLSERDLPPLDA